MSTCLSPVEAYRRWAPEWDSTQSAIVELERRHLSPWLRDLAGKTIIDVGCGTGRWMASCSGARVFGVDLSEEMLRCAGRKPAVHGRIAAADILQTPFPDSCADIVLCALTLAHCPDAGAAMRELRRVVRPGGELIISDFHPDALRRGWKRTFKSGGQTFEAESFPYRPEEIAGDCERIDACFDEPERAVFVDSGHAEMFERVRGLPAVLLLRLRRP